MKKWSLRHISIIVAIAAVAVPFSMVTAQESCTYTATGSDTLSGIASRFSLQLWQLQEENQVQYPNVWDGVVNPGWELDVCYGDDIPAQTPASDPAPANEPAAPAEIVSPTGVVAFPRNPLNIRTGPGATFQAIGSVSGVEGYPVLGRNGDAQWALIEYAPGQQGWIAAFLTDFRGAFINVPVVPGTEQPAAAPAAGPSVSGGSGFFELGGQTQGFDNPGVMQSAGMTWVKLQYKWGPGNDPGDLANPIADAHAKGFKVLISIPGDLYPSSIDFVSYTQFLGNVAALGADAIEVWNEQNLDREWPAGTIDPAAYVNNMLAPAYQAIKTNNPQTIVVSGAPAPTGVHNVFNIWADNAYVDGMAAAGAARYMDCVGLHYNAGATSPYATTGHPASPGGGHYSWYFQPTFDVYANAFPNKPLCFTEIGYLTPAGYGGAPSLFFWGGATSLQQQAQWLGEAAQISRASGRVRLFIVFNVDFRIYGEDPQAGYAILRPDGACPACATLAAAVQ